MPDNPTGPSVFHTACGGAALNSQKLTVNDVAGIVIGLLAENIGVSSGDLRTELAAAGPQLPVDSLLVAEVLTRVEDACGVRIHVDAEAARSTRSVMTFARTVHKAIRDGGGWVT
jgi:acyl carrier protein